MAIPTHEPVEKMLKLSFLFLALFAVETVAAQQLLPWGHLTVPAPPPAPGETAVPENPLVPKTWPKDSRGFENLALGKQANASSCIAGYEIHQIKNLNDGRFGNAASWISAGDPSWVEIDLGTVYWIDTIAFGSDSARQFSDRGIEQCRILVAMEPDRWTEVGPPKNTPAVQVRTEFTFPPIQARFVRIVIDKATNQTARIDELEIYGQTEPIPPELAAFQETKQESKATPKIVQVDEKQFLEDLKLSIVDEEYAWLKTAGYADLDPGLTNTPYPIKKHPKHVPDEVVSLVRIDQGPTASWNRPPVIDGILDDPIWDYVSQGIARVAKPADFETGAYVEYRVRAMRDAEFLYGAITTNRLLSMHLAVVATETGGGLLCFEDNKILWRVYGSNGQVVKEQPLDAVASSDAKRFEFKIPLELLGDTEHGVQFGLGIGGRYTPNTGRPVLFSPHTAGVGAFGPKTGEPPTPAEFGLNDRDLVLQRKLEKRRQILGDPELGNALDKILFEKRYPLEPSHNYSDYFDENWRTGGGVYTLEIPKVDGVYAPEKATLTELVRAEGMVRHATPNFDLSKIYYSRRESREEYWHIWEMNPDGTGHRQITDGPFHDLWPTPLPDGDLCFITTRCKAKFLCWRPQASVLFRMKTDGTGMTPLSFANLTEWAPSITDDGRILWTRSEYIDKGSDYGHTLWTIRPDGTMPELAFGNTIVLPQGYANGREIPGTKELCATMISHFGDLNGPIAILDIEKGRFNPDAITSITPEVPWPGYWARCETFREPFPISKNYFLVSHSSRDRFGLYLIDRFGNRELLYMDDTYGSMCPIPMQPRPVPPVIGSTIDPELAKQNLGVFTVADVYNGVEPTIRRGQAKYLQISQELRANLEQNPDGSYRSDHEPFMEFYAAPVDVLQGPFGWTSYVAKTSWGTVPIEEDGSASFYAPAGNVLYFHLLDENYNELQRMRSVVQLQPGETRSCVGCHDDRSATPVIRDTLAIKQEPRAIEPPPWGNGPFDYQALVQPVWDRNCVRCHNAETPNKFDLSATLDEHKTPQSYKTIVKSGLVHHFDWGWNSGVPSKAEPLTFGTARTKLWDVLKDEHHRDVSLTTDEKRTIKCWTDLSLPLWPDYIQRSKR